MSVDDGSFFGDGMSTQGRLEDSILATLALSMGEMPRVRLHETNAGPGSDSGGTEQGEPPPISDASARPERLQLFGVLGRGGMGVVLRAHDADLGRELAVKVLRESYRDQPDMVRRFVEEAQIGGQLQHPGIVPVYELGNLADRRPYIAMRLVKGRTLTDLLASRTSPADDLPRFLGIFESVCLTMAYAHSRGVIHRDLKPSNIMVGGFGEVQVMDWGLAKVLARAASPAGLAQGEAAIDGPEAPVATGRSTVAGDASQPGSVLGTPAYMAPEQARGEVDALDERADVFALGSILCEILTGGPAFVGGDWAELERKAAQAEVDDAAARLATCGADLELTRLAAECLAARAEWRPRDAGAVAARISAYQAGVQERLRAAELARARAQARADGERRRRRLAVALAVAVLGLVVCGGGAAAWAIYQRQAWLGRVAVALREAELLYQQARDDPAGMLEPWQAALAAVRRLRDLRDGGHAPAVRDRIDELAAQVARGAGAAEVDRRLVNRLDEVRAGMIADDKADAAFAEAFARAELDLTDRSADPVAIGRRLAGRPAAVALAAATGLDTWAVVRRYVDRAHAEGADPTAARRILAAARAADPDPWRNALRDALADGDAEALQRLAADPDLEHRAPVGIWLLGHSLEMSGAHDRALEVLRCGRLVYPGDFWLNFELGLAVVEGERSGLGATNTWMPARGVHDARYQRAEPYFTAAVALRPTSGAAHLLLASVTLNQGKLAEGLAEMREALRLLPDEPTIHNGLGAAYHMRGEFTLAEAEFRAALRLKPDYRIAQCNLGDLLIVAGRSGEAAKVYEELIARHPDSAPGHAGLARARVSQRRLQEAADAYREAIRLAPRYALLHSGLGGVLRQLGDYDGASAAYRTAFEVYPDPQWQALMRNELARTGSRALMAPRLAAVLRGSDQPSDATETLEFAYLARERFEFAGAALLFDRAFKLEPALADDRNQTHRYYAACSAASVGGHPAVTAPRSEGPVTVPIPADAAALRRAALEWLRAELTAWSGLLRDGQPGMKAQLLQYLLQWKLDAELSSVRDNDALARLPESERRGWQSLWADVDSAIATLRSENGASPAQRVR